jgi:hypothetical protein
MFRVSRNPGERGELSSPVSEDDPRFSVQGVESQDVEAVTHIWHTPCSSSTQAPMRDHALADRSFEPTLRKIPLAALHLRRRVILAALSCLLSLAGLGVIGYRGVRSIHDSSRLAELEARRAAEAKRFQDAVKLHVAGQLDEAAAALRQLRVDAPHYPGLYPHLASIEREIMNRDQLEATVRALAVQLEETEKAAPLSESQPPRRETQALPPSGTQVRMVEVVEQEDAAPELIAATNEDPTEVFPEHLEVFDFEISTGRGEP